MLFDTLCASVSHWLSVTVKISGRRTPLEDARWESPLTSATNIVRQRALVYSLAAAVRKAPFGGASHEFRSRSRTPQLHAINQGLLHDLGGAQVQSAQASRFASLCAKQKLLDVVSMSLREVHDPLLLRHSTPNRSTVWISILPGVLHQRTSTFQSDRDLDAPWIKQQRCTCRRLPQFLPCTMR